MLVLTKDTGEIFKVTAYCYMGEDNWEEFEDVTLKVRIDHWAKHWKYNAEADMYTTDCEQFDDMCNWMEANGHELFGIDKECFKFDSHCVKYWDENVGAYGEPIDENF